MSDDELTKEEEDKITALMAHTFRFVPYISKTTGKVSGYKCEFCSKHLFLTYVGADINDRMISHAKKHGIGLY